MDPDASRGLLRHFDPLQDPRRLIANYRHRLSRRGGLAIVSLAVLCGAESWVRHRRMAHLGRCKLSWPKTFLSLEHAVASDQSFGRVFAMLDPDQLEHLCSVVVLILDFNTNISESRLAVPGAMGMA